MGKILLLLLIMVTGFSALMRPWIGISSYYFLSLLGPQYIWWWVFDGVRVSLLVAGFAIAGIGIDLLKGNLAPRLLKTRLNLYVLLLWVFLAVSYWLGPFVDLYASGGRTPEQIFSLMNNVFLFYFCATITVDDLKKIRYLTLVMVVSVIYLAYWANDQYLSANWSQFNMGRLMGPRSIGGGSIYGDENAFAMFFVTGLPFVFYLGMEVRKKWLRYLLWAVIPLGGHAIFLTGSRGGLLGICVTLFVGLFLSKRKILAIPVLLGAFMFYQWQAGSVMKDRSEIIAEYEGDRSATDRLDAWGGGVKMILTHPVTGVGLGSFVTALPIFIEHRPMVAHNTLIQFAAESGLGAGVCYVLLIYTFYRNARRVLLRCNAEKSDETAKRIDQYNKTCMISFSGLVVCSLFLSLNTYEIFFFLLIINNSLAQICQEKLDPA
ncbi:O-antigen ligase family protein [Pelobacter propionicus]|uniref:O-antigen ligase family protein n=1 Tax=Pelobacter propionicus TaxID=29543 RepID=UPI0003103EF7|nr:O-antigen ligase family protein [Pelobacter propionicus]